VELPANAGPAVAARKSVVAANAATGEAMFKNVEFKNARRDARARTRGDSKLRLIAFPQANFLRVELQSPSHSTLARIQDAERFNAPSIVVQKRRRAFLQSKVHFVEKISSFSNQLFEEDLLRQIEFKTDRCVRAFFIELFAVLRLPWMKESKVHHACENAPASCWAALVAHPRGEWRRCLCSRWATLRGAILRKGERKI
jgi:hypothetical protein